MHQEPEFGIQSRSILSQRHRDDELNITEGDRLMIDMTGYPGWPALSGEAVRVIVHRNSVAFSTLGVLKEADQTIASTDSLSCSVVSLP